MIIRKLHIDGFGKFNDFDFDAIPSGLLVIYGDNEAGKSTLLAFLRTVLFGFPDRRSKENDYPPLRGGVHGGTLSLEAAGGRLHIIERWQGPRGGVPKVTLPDGRFGDGRTLEQLLGFATRDLFGNVFAFSLDELQQFESLNDEKVKSTIYSAGMGTGRLSLPTIDKELATSQEGLFKKRGNPARLNLKIKELSDVREKLKTMGDQVQRFDELHAELTRAEAEIVRLHKEQAETRLQNDGARMLLDVWDDWLSLCETESALSTLPEIITFPQAGSSQLDHLEERLIDLEERIGQKDNEIRVKREQIESLPVEEPILQEEAEIGRLQRGRDSYDKALRDKPVCERELVTQERRLAEELLELGPDWNKEKLQGVNTSVSEQEIIRGHRESLRLVENSLRDRRQSAEIAEKAVAAATQEEQDKKDALNLRSEPEERDPNALAAKIRTLRDLASQARQQAMLEEKIAHLREREEDLSSQQRQAETQLKVSKAKLPLWPVPAIVFFGIGLAVFTILQGSGIAAAVVGVFLGLLVPGGYLLIWQRSSKRGAGEDDPAVYLRVVAQRLAGVRQELSTAESLHVAARTRTATLAENLEVTDLIGETVVNNLIAETETTLETCRHWGLARREWEHAAALLDTMTREFADAGKAMEAADRELEKVVSDWQQWLTSAGLRAGISPDSALAIFGLVKQCRELAKTAEDLKDLIEQNAGYLADYQRSVRLVAAICGFTSGEGIDAGVVLDRLIDALAVAKENGRQRTILSAEITKASGEKALLLNTRKSVDDERNALVAAAGAASSQEFREREAVWLRRQQLKTNIGHLESALTRVAGQGERLVALKRDLAKMEPEEQRMLRQETEERLTAIEEALKTALNKQGAVTQQLRDLENQCDTGELRLQEQSLLAEISEEARKWAVYRVTRRVIQEARERYERERQPGVIKDASTFFKQMTREDYSQIFSAPEESALDVLDRQGHRKDMLKLSRGTREQLYFSVRLGLIREFSQRQESLPVIMDDILVNFDPARAEAALGAILDLASTHQVFLFTCHPETCDLVRNMSPEVPIYHLLDGQLLPRSQYIRVDAV